tara:strand:+ start:2973 stop:3743 length:771 start_codon:yes stop_codon:yes gene_type:complete
VNTTRILLLGLALALAACTPSKNGLKKVLEENPDIVFDVIKDNPLMFLETANEAARNAQTKQREKQQEDEQKALEDELKNPKEPKIEDSYATLGPEDAPITIVEYSDFMCGYCAKGYQTIKSLKEKYDGKIRFVYKHMPILSDISRTAAQYFEAIAKIDAEKAYKFHDHIFQNQGELRSKREKFLEEATRKAGANLAKVKKMLDDEDINAKIDADMSEGRGFGFSGTPGFLVNGVSLRGAYPQAKFEEIFDRLGVL